MYFYALFTVRDDRFDGHKLDYFKYADGRRRFAAILCDALGCINGRVCSGITGRIKSGDGRFTVKFMIFAIISLTIYILGAYADVWTTMESADGSGGLFEKNKRYRQPNGDANIKKLAIDKFLLGGICLAVVLVTMFSGLDFKPFDKSICFALFLVVGVLHLNVARMNWNLLKKIHAVRAGKTDL